MTLASFSAEDLDQLALSLLDLAGKIRGMAHLSREHDLPAFNLHGNKLQEWLGHLEAWTHEGASKMEASVFKLRGLRRQQNARPTPAGRSAKPKKAKSTARRTTRS